jgi:hypothetical protein
MRHKSSSGELVRLQANAPLSQHDLALNTSIAAAERPGLVAAARINAGAFAASVAAHHAVMLSRSVDVAVKVSPGGDLVYRDILMAYGAFATNEIQRLGFHQGGQR